jgi:integrase/recombinase XerD
MGFNPMRDRSLRDARQAHLPARQRTIDDMTARRFKEKVQKDYVRRVRTFAAFLGRSSDAATS